MTSKTRFDIVNGPSKMDLMLALFDKPRSSHPAVRTVDFEALIPVPVLVTMSVTSVQAEDGSRESWNVEGYVYGAEHLTPGQSDSSLPVNGKRLFVYYRTAGNRHGSLTFLP
jgi:hypothetical protein